MIMIPNMSVNEVINFVMTFIYVLILVAAVRILYKNHKTSKAVYDLCASQDACRDMINKMIEYAQTSDDIATNRTNHVAHMAAIMESILEIYRLFQYSIDTHSTFSREWADVGLTFSELYNKSLFKAVLTLNEVKSGKYVRRNDINYDSLVNGSSAIEDDDGWNDWIDMNIHFLKIYVCSENQAIMCIAVANILQIPIEQTYSREI